jgi:hypothetical protein
MKSEFSFIEPLVGLRLGLWFTPKLNLLLRADCGGFGAVMGGHAKVLEAAKAALEKKEYL